MINKLKTFNPEPLYKFAWEYLWDLFFVSLGIAIITATFNIPADVWSKVIDGGLILITTLFAYAVRWLAEAFIKRVWKTSITVADTAENDEPTAEAIA